LALVAAAAPHAQQAAAPEPSQLPVRRVVLYKSGVGYFEHQGSVTGSVDVSIQFTSGQLNDVLKSLTALDLDNGQISSIGYNSVAPLDQRLAALRVPLGTRPDVIQFYNALRGARVEVRTGTSVTSGRLFGIERKPARDVVSEPIDVLTVISNEGTVRSIVLRPNVTVRIAEQDLREDIGRYLAVVASARDQDVRRMTLAASGNGTRRLLVSYISEVPIWKSTYRLVLPENHSEQAVLQGWAIVDNTVGTDWSNVELSLVAGVPQSFVQQVSQPYYARRPVVALPQTAQLVPQTHQATLEARGQLDAPVAMAAPAPVRPAPGAGLPRLAETVVVTGQTPAVDVQSSARQVIVPGVVAQMGAQAIAQELGDLFEYKVAKPVTIRTNQSAMVPILNARVAAERVSLWNRTPGAGRPLRAVWVTNASGLTLDGGSLSVIDSNAFAGEGLVEPLKPSEKRLISYGTDLSMIVDARQDEASGVFKRVIARDGVIVAEQEYRERWVYRVRNQDAAPRTLVIEHPVKQGWTMQPEVAPVETTVNTARFRVPVSARSEAALRISERTVSETRVTIDELDDEQIAGFVERGVPEEEFRRALQPIIDARAQMAATERRIAGLTTQKTTIASDQQRIRENIQALGSARQERALRERYTRELNAQEDQLRELQAQIATLSSERDLRRAELSRLMQKLTFEVNVK
jgi:hypothetical protein